MDPLVWMVVGLVVGLLVPLVAGEGDGLFGNLLFGLLGAFVGGWLTDLLYTSLVGTAPAAFIAALLSVLALRLIGRASGAPA